MSLQAIINQHADAMVARHNQIENLIQDQAATRANSISERTEALSDSFDRTGSALGSAAGAYHLGRSVYRAYKARGLKGAAKELADKASKAKGDLKNIKADNEDDSADKPTLTEEGDEGDAGDAGAGEGFDPEQVRSATSQSIRDRFNRLKNVADGEQSQPTVPNEEANDDPSAPDDGATNPTESTEAASGSNEASVVNPGSDADIGNSLSYKMGSVAEPEDIQVARYSDMAQKVFNANRAKGLDIEGNPLREGLKPGERVLADVTKQTKPGTSIDSQPQPQGGDVEQDSVPPAEAQAEDPLPTTETQGKLFKDAPAPSDDAEAGQAADKPLNADSSSTPNIEQSATDDAVNDAANEGSNITSKVASKATNAIQNTGTDLTENISSKVGKTAGSLLEDTLPETLETVGGVLDAIPVVGEIAGVGLGLAGLFESIFGKHGDAAQQQKLIPTAPSASGIDPATLARANVQAS